MTDRRIEYVPLDEIVGADRNPKLHDAQSLAESLAEHGYAEPVMIDERTGKLVAGHGRVDALRAARAAGIEPPDGVRVDDGVWSVPVVRGWSSRDDAQASRYLIASNRLVERGGWDERGLADLLDDLAREDTLVGTGYAPDDLAALLDGLAAPVEPPLSPTDVDDVPAAPTDPVTVRGDVWLLGPHRLMCGDCRNADDVAVLLAEDRVNIAFTSPPYAEQRGYDPTSGFVPIHPDDYVEWFAPVAALVAAHLADDGSWFVNIKAAADGLDTYLYVLDLVSAHVRRWGWHYATEFCWERVGVPGRPERRFKNQFEPVYQFARGEWRFRPEAVRHPSDNVPIYDASGDGDNAFLRLTKDGTTTPNPVTPPTPGLAYPGNRLPPMFSPYNTGHSATFPVGLPEFFVKAFSDEGDIVYDPFVGSGSTLLAADQTRRVGRGMELSRAYCDVAARRYQQRTGVKPIRESTGEPVDFSAETAAGR